MGVVYLAGAISEVDPTYATEWRTVAERYLSGAGFEVLNPCAGKDLYAPGVNEDMFTPAQIVEADLEMIWQSDIILAEVGRRDIPYHGTSMEIAYAYQWKKTIIVWGGSRSYWIRYHATAQFKGLPQAIVYIIREGLNASRSQKGCLGSLCQKC